MRILFASMNSDLPLVSMDFIIDLLDWSLYLFSIYLQETNRSQYLEELKVIK